MASVQSHKVPRVRQARQSIAHIPSTDTVREKENVTVDTGAIAKLSTQDKQSTKKARSKSIGPGGLDALREDTGNKQPALPPHVKSILKPTITLSPPKSIPPHKNGRKLSPSKANARRGPEKSPRKSPKKSAENAAVNSSHASALNLKPGEPQSKSPSRSPARVAVRTEEEQQAAAKERERQAVLAYKDARRKSLANRRVSFAPEATLHTWNVVELPEDSTTSSASTNSTRRASGFTTVAGSPNGAPRSSMPPSAVSEPPSTPPEQAEEPQVTASPVNQRNLHQKKRRRSSGVPPMNFNNPEDFSSSPYSGADDDTNQSLIAADEIDGKSESSSSNDGDLVEDETVTEVDRDENTLRSTTSNSTGSSGRLDAVLRQAANQAGTQGIDYDENGDITMEMADDEVTNAFKPWMKKGKYTPQVIGDPSALQDQENLNPFSPAFKANVASKRTMEEDDDGTMDMTQVVGGILPTSQRPRGSPDSRRQNSTAGSRKRNSIAHRRSSGDASVSGDETMDLTLAVGGIQEDQPNLGNQVATSQESDGNDEELTMEFTSVIGGVVQPTSRLTNSADPLAKQQSLHDTIRRKSDAFSENDETMDMTLAAGGILPSITERTEPVEDQPQKLNDSTALEAKLFEQPSIGDKNEAKKLMEQETDIGQFSGSPFFGTPRQKPVGVGLTDERPLPGHLKMMASETGSPGLGNPQPRSSLRNDRAVRASITPKSQQLTPVKKPTTPKQLTPQPTRPTTPGKTPPSKNVSMRTSSPKKLFKAEIEADATDHPKSTPTQTAKNPLLPTDLMPSTTLPGVILEPKRRRSSGLGVEREGLGSPTVAALLDRRSSIGQSAKAFVSQGPAPAIVRFEDPQIMELELDQERAEDKRRESGRGILEDEANAQDIEEKDATTNLKDLIESLTPQKKRKLNGRKSLHVGAARGLLGKRPAELDDDEDEDSTPKRLKGRESSPVKKVMLPAPRPTAGTVGRISRSSGLSLDDITGNARSGTPVGPDTTPKTKATPRDQSRFKDAELGSPAKVASFEQKLDAGNSGTAEPTEEEDRIHLQEFLNLTSIRFMELTTTKRRHTVLPSALLEQNDTGDASSANRSESLSELENCVIAGACTVPMLELYQHSCRELKNYISEGRSVVKEIEADTYEENPPLFRKYISAAPDVKSNMDNQFKNVKTHARLLSKAMWYEWRMKLLDGLKEGLVKIGEGMNDDDLSLTQQEQMMQPVLPSLIEQHERLESEVQTAQAQADELADCDQDELRGARQELMSVERDLESKQKLLHQLQSQLREKENILGDVIERKQECVDEIKEAEKVRQDCRGWSSAEVSALQANVTALEASHGWTITSTTDSALTMTHNNTLQLFFTPSSFRPRDVEPSATPNAENSPISLTYVADAHPYHPQPLTTEKRFFLQIMRAQLQCLQQSQTTVKDLLAFVSSSWETATRIADEVHVLGVSYITEPTITSDEVLAVRSSVLLQSMRTKVEVGFEVKVRSGDGVAVLGVSVKPSAKVCYGEELKEKKMAEFLESKIKGVKGRGVWVKAVGDLEQRLRARGKKA